MWSAPFYAICVCHQPIYAKRSRGTPGRSCAPPLPEKRLTPFLRLQQDQPRFHDALPRRGWVGRSRGDAIAPSGSHGANFLIDVSVGRASRLDPSATAAGGSATAAAAAPGCGFPAGRDSSSGYRRAERQSWPACCRRWQSRQTASGGRQQRGGGRQRRLAAAGVSGLKGH